MDFVFEGRAVIDWIEKAKREGRWKEAVAGPAFSDRANSPKSEDEFQTDVILFAQARGWRVAHFRKSRTKHGWRTAVSADGKGFFDLVFVRERIVWAELKMPGNRPSADQLAWLAALLKAGAEAYVWYPKDWVAIEDILK